VFNLIKNISSSKCSQLKGFISTHLHVGVELQIACLQILAVILAASPKLFTSLNIWWSSLPIILGVFAQFRASRLTRKATIHEAFLKERVSSFFGNTIWDEKVKEAGFYREEIQHCLVAIARQIGIHHSSDHRIRLFIPLEVNAQREFSLVAFHADNPDLATSRNTYYPDDGVLGEAFRRGSCHVEDLADSKGNEAEWKQQQSNAGFMSSEESIGKINLKARSYLGMAIRSPGRSEKICVIIIESTKPHLQFQAHALKIMEHRYSWYIAKCVEKFIPYAPDPEYATQRGF
jgi:hypothetical protein